MRCPWCRGYHPERRGRVNDRCRCVKYGKEFIPEGLYCYCPRANDYYCPECGTQERKDWSNRGQLVK